VQSRHGLHHSAYKFRMSLSCRRVFSRLSCKLSETL
jgi:hypothetical protein